MGYSKRRITSHLYENEARSKQLMLHELYLDFLAKQILENVLPAEFIFSTDEVGVNLQPSEVEKWVKMERKSLHRLYQKIRDHSPSTFLATLRVK
jgi:hypothetical protein